jgi:hypothetical protein
MPVLRLVATGLTVMSLLVAPSAGAMATARAPMSPCSPAWRLVDTKSPKQSWFNSVAVKSPTGAWAVGAQENGERPLIAHWNGRTWRTVVGPVRSGKLTAVGAAAADDVWAVGYKRPGQAGANTYRPIVEHWDGSRWRSVPMPAGEAVLTSVAAVSSYSVWVGDRLGAVLRWDRTRWRVRVTGQTVNSIAARSEDDVWLVGSDDRVAASHWNGKTWAKTRAPTGQLRSRRVGASTLQSPPPRSGPSRAWSHSMRTPPSERSIAGTASAGDSHSADPTWI